MSGERSHNFPVLTDAVASGSAIRIRGVLDSINKESFRIEFFASPACDPSGYGEGKTFLGSTGVDVDDTCLGEFDVTFPVAVEVGQSITATSSLQSTSEFSACIPVQLPDPLRS